MLMQYLIRVGIAISVLFSVLLGGQSNQTFSARNYMWKKAGKFNFVKIIDLVFGNGHCCEGWVYWVVRKHKDQ
jgi:uncharacterized membrane protein YciS (DUF1049 family)